MSPIKPTIKTEIIPLLIIIAVVISSFYFYANFPDTVATHWNFQGEPDAYSSKAVASLVLPSVIIGMYLLFLFLPLIDPKKERYDQFRKVYHFFKGFIVFFMAGIYAISGLSNLGYAVSIKTWIPLMVGALFVLMGNYMSKIKQNWFIGIRTPWTLSSEEVWNKTHRVGGKIFMLGGILLVAIPYFGEKIGMTLFFIDIAIIVLGTVVYSYFIYRKEKGKK